MLIEREERGTCDKVCASLKKTASVTIVLCLKRSDRVGTLDSTTYTAT